MERSDHEFQLSSQGRGSHGQDWTSFMEQCRNPCPSITSRPSDRSGAKTNTKEIDGDLILITPGIEALSRLLEKDKSQGRRLEIVCWNCFFEICIHWTFASSYVWRNSKYTLSNIELIDNV
ncbi:unnamed protein product [Cuscuta epithymum]|uniref:Uncharacterized protein n=1 Tax=Cuscuta epithymum TaxID=186058 RepID=A0AAV0EQ24_9ASTE|nr:unnamed protein product [Cuscuta epithymum]